MTTANKLIVLTGTLKGKEIRINGVITIGRNPENIIQLDDLQVSRKHAQVLEKGNGIYLIDLGSGNGTYIGGQRIVEYRLDDGEIFRMGRQQIQFRAGRKMEPPSSSQEEEETKSTVSAPPKIAPSQTVQDSSLPAMDDPVPQEKIPQEPADDISDLPAYEDDMGFGEAKAATDDLPAISDPLPNQAVSHQETADDIEPPESSERIKSRRAENLYQTFFQAPVASASGAELEAIQKRLRAVYAANEAIASERSLEKVFDNIMSQVFSLVKAHNGLIMLKHSDSEELNVEYVRSADSGSKINVSSTIIKRVYEEGEAIITSNAADDSRFDGGMSIITANITSAMCVPLTHQDERLGVIYVDTRGTTNAFTESDLEMLVAVAAPAATAIKNAQYLKMVQQAYEDTLVALANAIELRDHYTVGHTWRVTNFAVEMARQLNWDEEKLKEVQMGGVLHDVGKIAVDNAILSKPGHLTDEEFAQMKVHPERGADLLRDIKFLHPLIPYCLAHHERWDGGGYPKGLKYDDIPVEGRLICVADAFDAMTSTRPYRKGMDPKVALDRIKEGQGKQFDMEMVTALEDCYLSGKIDSILQDYYKNEARSIACPFCSTFIRFDETITDGSEIECSVCHRKVRIIQKDETFYGVLAQKSEE